MGRRREEGGDGRQCATKTCMGRNGEPERRTCAGVCEGGEEGQSAQQVFGGRGGAGGNQQT